MSQDKGPELTDTSSERLPHKPTREGAAREGDPAAPNPSHLGTGRQEVDAHASEERQEPHVTPQDEEGPLQDDIDSPSDVPALPANASGHDKVTADEQNQEVDEESMYDRRPEQDKDRPPSEREKEK